jgi:hypothetical protein
MPRDTPIRPCQVRIGRWSGSDGQEAVIELEDEVSGVRLLEIHLSLAALGEAITGMSTEAYYEVTGSFALAGMRREYKEEAIFVPQVDYNQHNRQNLFVAQALKPYEVDGWVARPEDMYNHHRQTSMRGNPLIQLALKAGLEDHAEKGHIALVGFVRYVNPDTNEPVLRT